ncbi:MAG: acetyl/propionyl-CoA carboxylase subuit alpha [Friedmanniella sp.]|nr:acetyl/propionyl-CoA carboxylase subuit alpha [Friedmanniella sp.]
MSPIRTLLVANRGEIACRVLRTARGMGIGTVAVFSDADVDAPHVAQADRAVRLPGVSPADTYLRGDLLVAAARRTGADAVHPGYGFLSENAAFARQVGDAGLTFVGPAPDVIAAMGSKIRAKALMTAAGVPVLPGATVGEATDPAGLAALGAGVGYPLLVKASAGGGGRGMRIVTGPAGLVEAVAGARREAASAFGDDTVFLERYLLDPRHIEVQIFGDQAGTVLHLFERECSVQRRFQKVIEEAPSPAVGPELRERLGAAATAAGRALGYVGAGTVEFVLDAAGDFFFLEVNTRLQVEHPVTELVTGLDLVRLQLLVAQGDPLPPEVTGARLAGHAIEARLYAEDPLHDFLPTTGRLRAFAVPDTVRTDAGFRAGQTVTPYYDALLAKVVAVGPTRAEAAATLAAALRDSRLHGVRTNRDLLVAVLSEPEFLAGGTDTGYLDRHPPADLLKEPVDRWDEAAVAAVLALRADRRRQASVQVAVTAGWRNVVSGDPTVRLRAGGDPMAVRTRGTGEEVEVWVDGRPLGLVGATVHGVPGADSYRVSLERDGLRQGFLVTVDDDHLDVHGPAGSVDLIWVDPLPAPAAADVAGSLLAPMPGLVVRVETAAGQPVQAGQALLVVEAMKMEHTVRAPHAGVLEAVLVAVGEQVDVGQRLVVLGESAEGHDGGDSP